MRSSAAHGRRRKRAQIRRRVLLAGSICVLFFCVLGLAGYAVQALRSDQVSREFRVLYAHSDAPDAVASPAPLRAVLQQYEVSFSGSSGQAAPAAPPAPARAGWPDNPAMTVSAGLKSLHSRNRDVIGWLSIPGVLEQPVVQRDNAYYLRRDALGSRNDNGALFLEEGISLQSRPDAYIIFGHNMKTGGMFGSLRLYEDVGYYRQNALIDFNVLYEDGQYVVFAVSDIATVQGLARYAPFLQLPGMDAEGREACIRQLRAWSHIASPVQAGAEDQLLLLVTCEGSEDSRRVVAARRLREGETAEGIRSLLQRARKQ